MIVGWVQDVHNDPQGGREKLAVVSLVGERRWKKHKISAARNHCNILYTFCDLFIFIMKMLPLFESYSADEITFEIKEDTSLGEFAKQIWVKAMHPEMGSVGHVKLIQVNPEPMENANPDLDKNSRKNFDRARLRFSLFNPTVWSVDNSWIDRRWRGEGIGQVLYLHALKYVAENYKSVMVPNRSWAGETSTSLDAERVWSALARQGIPHVGDVFWGGSIQDSQLRVIPRRGHGWEEHRTGRPRQKNWRTDYE